MAAKRKIVINRKPKAEVVEEIKEEVKEIKEEEVMEEVVKEVKEIQKREVERRQVMGTVGGTEITKPKGRIVFEAQMGAYPMYRLPDEIRKYLQKKGLTTEVYKKDKEWLERHHVDLEMVEKLKNFLTRRD